MPTHDLNYLTIPGCVWSAPDKTRTCIEARKVATKSVRLSRQLRVQREDPMYQRYWLGVEEGRMGLPPTSRDCAYILGYKEGQKDYV